MKRAVQAIVIIVALVIALLIGATALVQTPWARGVAEDQLSQRLDGRAVEIGYHDIEWGWPLGIRAEDIRIANPDWTERPYLLELDALEAQLDVGALLTGHLALHRLALERPRLDLIRQANGQATWSVLAGKEDAGDSEPPIQPDRVKIDGGRLYYEDALYDAQMTIDIDTRHKGSGERQLFIVGEGRVQGQPLSLKVSGEPPARALSSQSPYAVSLDARLGELRARFTGQAHDVLALEGIQGQFDVAVPDAAPLMRFATPPIDVPAFKLSGRILRQGERWTLGSLELSSGNSQLTGEAVYEQGQTPMLRARLHGNQLDLNRWGVMRLLTSSRSTEAKPDQAAKPTPSTDWLERLKRYRADLEIHLERLHYGDATLSDITLDAHLADGQLNIDRLHVDQDEGQLDLQAAIDMRAGAPDGRVDLEVDTLDLGQALAPLGFPRLGTLDAHVKAHVSSERVQLQESQLHYHASASALRLKLDAQSTDSGLQVEGRAWRHQTPARFELTLGPLLAMFDRQPYPIEGHVVSGDTRLTLTGSVTKPLALQAADLQLSIGGTDTARLEPLTGLTLPNVGAYQARAQLLWGPDRQLRLQDVRAEWGQSDVSGDLRLSLSGPPMLWANLHSNRLRTRDLTGEQAPARSGDGQVFSDEALELDVLRGHDAIVRYQAERLEARDMPLDAVNLKAELRNDVLNVDPLHMGVGQGTAEGTLFLDLRPAQPSGELQLTLTSVNLSPVLRSANLTQVAQDSAGTLGGTLDISFAGRSPAAMFESLDGRLELAMEGGELDMLALEVLGLDAGEAMLAALSEADQVPMKCAYVRFEAEQSTARLEQLFIHTADSNITGGGTINLASEQLDLAFEAHAKDPSFFSGNSPVRLEGTLSDPQAEVVTGELLARAAASVAGAIVAPPLAILPWLEAGLGEGAGIGCREALSEVDNTGRG